MSYSPCTECQRHVRNTEQSCPFCGHGVPSRRARAAAPSGLKRAALVALGTGLTAMACGREESSNVTPIYGAPVVPEEMPMGMAGSGGVPAGEAGSGSGGSNESGEGTAGAAAQPTPEPPMPTMGEGPMAMMPSSDPLPVPIYGAPIPPEELPVGMAGAPAMGGAGGASGGGGSVNAGGAAGEAAEADAGAKEDAGFVEPEGQGGEFQGQGGFQVQPLYGAVPAPVYGAVPAPTEN